MEKKEGAKKPAAKKPAAKKASESKAVQVEKKKPENLAQAIIQVMREVKDPPRTSSITRKA